MGKPGRSLKGLRALVTGASSGIGWATCEVLASRGAVIAGSGRNTDALRAGQQAGLFTATVPADLTGPGAPAGVVSAAVEALGGLDLVVSCAGAGWSGRFEEMATSDIDALLRTNLGATLHLAHAAAAHLLASPAPGQLVLVGSIAGLLGVPEEAVYSATKGALGSFANALRAEWHPVTVTLVSPGAVATPFFARRNRPYLRSWPRPVPVAQVAAAIVAAVEHRRREVIVPRWLAVPARLQGACPGLYAALARAPGLWQGRR